MTVGGMGFIPERLLMMMMMILCGVLPACLPGRSHYDYMRTVLLTVAIVAVVAVTGAGVAVFAAAHTKTATRVTAITATTVATVTPCYYCHSHSWRLRTHFEPTASIIIML